MEVQCIYHEDKFLFDHATKDLMRCGWIPKKYAKRLAMAVCACRKRGLKTENIDFDQLSHTVCDVLTYMAFLDDPQKYPVLYDYIETLTSVDLQNHYSHLRFITILHQTSHKNFDELVSNRRVKGRPAIKNLEERALDEKKPRIFKFASLKANGESNVPYNCMMRRKMRKMRVNEHLVLPMYFGSWKILNERLGKDLQTYAKLNECVIIPWRTTNKMNFQRKKIVTEINLYCVNKEQLDRIAKEIKGAAEQIQNEQDSVQQLRIETRKEIIKQQKLYADYLEDFEITDGFWLPTHRDKIDRENEYSQKVIAAKRKGRSSKQKRGAELFVRKRNVGRCVNCMKTTELDNDDSTCSFHSGYTACDASRKRRTYFWTCCAKEPLEQKPTYKDHVTQGCKNGVHIWHRTKAGSNKRCVVDYSEMDVSIKVSWKKIPSLG